MDSRTSCPYEENEDLDLDGQIQASQEVVNHFRDMYGVRTMDPKFVEHMVQRGQKTWAKATFDIRVCNLVVNLWEPSFKYIFVLYVFPFMLREILNNYNGFISLIGVGFG